MLSYPNRNSLCSEMLPHTYYLKGIIMLEIEGKVNSALSFASLIDDGAIEQIKRMCDYDLTKGSQIRIMPDVHKGKGCTIGTTMTLLDRVCPNIVGVDIGCGMYTVKLKNKSVDFSLIDKVAHYIPSSNDVWNEKKESYDLTRLHCYSSLSDPDRLERSLGTLGGGNHFIEIDKSEDGTLYLVIHSGSRNLGLQVASIYQKRAIEECREEERVEKERVIDALKEEGREEEIQKVISGMEIIPDDLCYLKGIGFSEYLDDTLLCQDYARRNRELMASILIEECGLETESSFHTIHNYIDSERMILRKGAIRAEKGEMVLIPINMRDGSVLAYGRGNEDWNYSAPHGAGRVLSRSAAEKSVSLSDYIKSMEGIYTTSVKLSTIDESPFVYKSLDDIIPVLRDTVDILEIIKPVFNFKAS